MSEKKDATWVALDPREYVRGDGKTFWRPVVRRLEKDVPTDYWLTYMPYLSAWKKEWRLVTYYPSERYSPVIYRSRNRAIRVAEREVKRRNRDILMTVKEV